MLETDNWVLPQVYANEFAYKPPLAHWLMAVASLPQGYVSEFTSRLPSALAFIILIGFTLVFFGKRLRFQQAFIATLLLITCIEIHRAAMTTRVDMLLTTFIVIGLYQLYRWEDKLELKGVLRWKKRPKFSANTTFRNVSPPCFQAATYHNRGRNIEEIPA